VDEAAGHLPFAEFRAASSNRRADDADVCAGEHRVEGGGELGISVADKEPEPADPTFDTSSGSC
jgi:hypothetical protein